MTAEAKLTARIASLETEQLKELAVRMALPSTNEEIIVGAAVDRELEKRMPEADFVVFMEELELMTDLAA